MKEVKVGRVGVKDWDVRVGSVRVEEREREGMEMESTKFGSGEFVSWECESGE